MFNINDIYQDPYTSLYCCACQCTTEMDAKVLSAKLILPTNMLSNFSVQVGYVGTWELSKRYTPPWPEQSCTGATFLNLSKS